MLATTLSRPGGYRRQGGEPSSYAYPTRLARYAGRAGRTGVFRRITTGGEIDTSVSRAVEAGQYLIAQVG